MDNLLTLRPDLEIILNETAQGAKVLDLGCGDGVFLKMLKQKRNAEVLGFEIDQKKIAKCIANGVPVIQGDLDINFDFFVEEQFDMVIVGLSLQEIKYPAELLEKIVKIGKSAAISFINFGHISCRLQLLLKGRMPLNKSIPHQWYNTPNIHLGTIKDFRKLCDSLNIKIIKEIPTCKVGKILPNLFATESVFLISGK